MKESHEFFPLCATRKEEEETRPLRFSTWFTMFFEDSGTEYMLQYVLVLQEPVHCEGLQYILMVMRLYSCIVLYCIELREFFFGFRLSWGTSWGGDRGKGITWTVDIYTERRMMPFYAQGTGT